MGESFCHLNPCLTCSAGVHQIDLLEVKTRWLWVRRETWEGKYSRVEQSHSPFVVDERKNSLPPIASLKQSARRILAHYVECIALVLLSVWRNEQLMVASSTYRVSLSCERALSIPSYLVQLRANIAWHWTLCEFSFVENASVEVIEMYSI